MVDHNEKAKWRAELGAVATGASAGGERRRSAARAASRGVLPEKQLAFRNCRGMTPMAALRRIRLEAARAALADGPTSIRTIAAAYRFTNPGRFAKWFKEVFGQSPSELRRTQDRASR